MVLTSVGISAIYYTVFNCSVPLNIYIKYFHNLCNSLPCLGSHQTVRSVLELIFCPCLSLLPISDAVRLSDGFAFRTTLRIPAPMLPRGHGSKSYRDTIQP
jgi:hypothetical protein